MQILIPNIHFNALKFSVAVTSIVFSNINSQGDRVSDLFRIQLITQPTTKGKTLKISVGERELALALLPKTEDERFKSIDKYPWRIDVYRDKTSTEPEHSGSSPDLTFAQAFAQAKIIKNRFLGCDRVLMTPIVVNQKLSESEIQDRIRHLTELL